MAMMGPGGARQRRGRMRSSGGFNEINVTPFVDVMLVLLIIFMVAAPMMTTGVKIDLPKTKSTTVPGTDEPLSVTITADGDVYIQNTKVKVDALGGKLKAILGEKRETRIFVRGDTAANYGAVMRAIGEINAAGYNKVALLTDLSGKKDE